MQPVILKDARPIPKPPSVVLIVIQCLVLAALFTGTGLVLATAIVNWTDLP